MPYNLEHRSSNTCLWVVVLVEQDPFLHVAVVGKAFGASHVVEVDVEGVETVLNTEPDSTDTYVSPSCRHLMVWNELAGARLVRELVQ